MCVSNIMLSNFNQNRFDCNFWSENKMLYTKPTEVLNSPMFLMRPPSYSLSLFVCSLCLSFNAFNGLSFAGILQQNVRPFASIDLPWNWTGVSDFRFTWIQVSSYIHSDSAFGKCTTTQLSRALDLIICNRTKCIHNWNSLKYHTEQELKKNNVVEEQADYV